jgi:NAD(P)-dependent dehydrogenase (short-subunit alcohol dehydrogenase family)
MIAATRDRKVALRFLGTAVPLFPAPPARTMNAMTTTLITGANKGLGYATAGALIAAGHEVWIGARDAARGMEAADALGARFVALDVTDQPSVDAAARRIDSEGGLDVLINNAGVSSGFQPIRETTADDLLRVYATNVLGVVRVTHAFLPLLERSDVPVIVNVSSGMGSLAFTTDPDRLESTINSLAYPSSKTAVNMLTTQYAKGLPRFRVNAVDPGYTATDLNQHRGTQTVAEGAEPIIAMAQIGPDGPTGTFAGRDGAVPW